MSIAAPQPLDEDKVSQGSLARYHKLLAMPLWRARRCGGGRALRTLVGVGYLRLLASQEKLQRLDAEAGLHQHRTRHDSTRRMNESSTTASSTKPRAIGI